ncbi:MAG: hypothetical protein U0457_06130 [Candidatus Sericytochromatia bacterium]
MSKREILGYSIYFKKEVDAEKFFKSVPKEFDSTYDKKEKEVTILGCKQVYKEDFEYVFSISEDINATLEPSKVEFMQTLFARG